MALREGFFALIAVSLIGSMAEGGEKPIKQGWERQEVMSEGTQLLEEDFVMDPDNIRFYLYTNPRVPTRVFTNDTDMLRTAGYRVGKQTKVLVHGFLNHLTSPAIQEIKDNFLNSSHKEVNIVAVDWKYYAFFYGNEYGRMRSLGGIIAEFLDFLVREGTKLEDLHCIGHSLGAHACGFAGASVKDGLIARISGLDPALPGFESVPADRRLNSRQAEMVDCIHTSAGYLAIPEPICSADFYPNRGSRQPGCEWMDYMFHGTCSHGRSYQYFAESIRNDHVFQALTCNSTDFLTAHCVDKGAKMGYPAGKKYKGIFYTETNDAYPYAKKIIQ